MSVTKRTRRAEPITKRTTRAGRVGYTFQIDAGVRLDGSRDRRRYTYPTLAEARRELRRISTEAAAGTLIKRDKLTVGEYLAGWLDGRRVRPNTLDGYRSALKPVIDHLGTVPLQNLDTPHLEDLVTLRLGGAPIPQRAKRGLVARNVAQLVDRPPIEHREMSTWTPKQAERFRDHVRGDRLYACWLLTLAGCRRSEVLGLAWSAVDFNAKTVTVAQGRVVVRGGGTTTGAPKSERSRRTLPMPAEVMAALRSLRTQQSAERLAFGQDYRDTGLVAVVEDGSPVRPETYSKAFARHCTAAGVPPIRLHDTRHTAATRMLDSGTTVSAAAKWLGHDPAMTLRVYGHVYDRAFASEPERCSDTASSCTSLRPVASPRPYGDPRMPPVAIARLCESTWNAWHTLGTNVGFVRINARCRQRCELR